MPDVIVVEVAPAIEVIEVDRPGPPGPPGSGSGNTILNGSGVPGSGLGVNGDFYIDNLNKRMYGPKTAGAWGAGFSLIGPAGIDGTDGTDGADGTDGTDGTDGAPGPGFYVREYTGGSWPARGTVPVGNSVWWINRIDDTEPVAGGAGYLAGVDIILLNTA